MTQITREVIAGLVGEYHIDRLELSIGHAKNALRQYQYALEKGIPILSHFEGYFAPDVVVRSTDCIQIPVQFGDIFDIVPSDADQYNWDFHRRVLEAFGSTVKFDKTAGIVHITPNDTTSTPISFYALETLAGTAGTHPKESFSQFTVHDTLKKLLTSTLVAPPDLIRQMAQRGIWYQTDYGYKVDQVIALPAGSIRKQFERIGSDWGTPNLPEMPDSTLVLIEPQYTRAMQQGPGLRAVVSESNPIVIQITNASGAEN